MASSVSIGLLSEAARVTSIKSANGLVWSQLETSGPTDRTPGTPGSDKNAASKQVHCPLAPFLHLTTGGHSVPGKITTTEMPVRNIGDHKSFATKHRSSREL